MTSFFVIFGESRAGFIKDYYQHWRIEYLTAHPQPPVVNVRFEHNPNWRNEFISLQATRDHIIAPITQWHISPLRVIWAIVEEELTDQFFDRALERAQLLRSVNATGPKIRNARKL